MKSYGIDMQGDFKVERVATLPVWETEDEGRLIYVESSDKLYYATGSTWSETGSSISLLSDGTVALAANWDAGSYKITAEQLESDVTTGTAPLVVASTTKVTNLNADQLDGGDWGSPGVIGGTVPTSGSFTDVVVSGGILIGPPDTDHTEVGLVSNLTAGESLVFGEVCYYKSDGKYWKSDADAEATMPIVVMSLETIGADGVGPFLKRGFVKDDAWSWTTGGLLYGSTTGGDITQTAPSGSGDQVQIVGYAYSADVIFFNPQYGMLEI
jgi:hypothetical protein